MKWITGVVTWLVASVLVFAAETPKSGQVAGKVVLLRAKPTRHSEILARLNEGTSLEIRERVELQTPKPGEPTAWYRVALAPHAKVWVHSLFIDEATKTVKPNRLNLRAGPGENYTILGRLNKGASIETLTTKGDWIQIAAPPDAYAFIAANFVKADEPATPPVTEEKPAEEKPTEIAKEETPAPAKVDEADLPTEAKPVAPATPPKPVVAETPVTPEPELSRPELDEPIVKPRRVVTREGIVRRNLNINSPSGFDLEDVRNGKHLNYLFTEDQTISFKKYLNKRVLVVGEEKMDYRWKHVPVLDLDSIEVIE